ncbi:MAG TPA: glycosyltransferase family 1 protein, partial [Roseiflexaceae bacterium]|nr:glycosyltransferase family 1 protein [Roseiflexaceae bacterium]
AEARAEVVRRFELPEPYIYYVGGLDARKNVATLVRAFARLRRAGGPEATLVIAGKALGDDPALFPNIDEGIAAERIGASVRRIDASAFDNPLLYAAATLFAFPSRYEGFGLGPLEAMACGTPCVVSNSSSLPEVVGDAALQVAPGDVAGWTAALWRVLADPALRAELTARGFEQVRRFSYERTARLTLGAYERALTRARSPHR